MLFFGVILRESARTAAKSRTNISTNSGKATIRLGRLAPNNNRVVRDIAFKNNNRVVTDIAFTNNNRVLRDITLQTITEC